MNSGRHALPSGTESQRVRVAPLWMGDPFNPLIA